MKEISQQEWNLLHELELGNVSEEYYINQFPQIVEYHKLKRLLINALVNNNNYNANFHTLFWVLPKDLSKDQKLELSKEFLLIDGHNEHEEIAGSFQGFFNNDIDNIPVLMEAIGQIPAYLEGEDFKYPYIRKIIYAIGAQPEPYNIEALETLTKLEDEEIKKLALHQIEKRKRLGRWEANKNEE